MSTDWANYCLWTMKGVGNTTAFTCAEIADHDDCGRIFTTIEDAIDSAYVQLQSEYRGLPAELDDMIRQLDNLTDDQDLNPKTSLLPPTEVNNLNVVESVAGELRKMLKLLDKIESDYEDD